MRTALIITAVLGSASTAASQPLPPRLPQPAPLPAPATTSYRAQTLAVDAVGIAMLIAGGLSEGEDGRDTKTSERLFGGGLLVVMFGAPTVHALNGQRTQGGRSLGLRMGLASAGALFAVAARSGCHDPDAGLANAFCHLDYVGYGVLGGFIVASLLDAAFMTDKPVKRPTWTPRVTASRDAVGVGASWGW